MLWPEDLCSNRLFGARTVALPREVAVSQWLHPSVRRRISNLHIQGMGNTPPLRRIPWAFSAILRCMVNRLNRLSLPTIGTVNRLRRARTPLRLLMVRAYNEGRL